MFRIKTTLNGKYIVEVKYKYFFGLFTKWKPYVTASGLDQAWEHETYQYAMMNLLDQVEEETNKISI